MLEALALGALSATALEGPLEGSYALFTFPPLLCKHFALFRLHKSFQPIIPTLLAPHRPAAGIPLILSPR